MQHHHIYVTSYMTSKVLPTEMFITSPGFYIKLNAWGSLGRDQARG